MLLPSERSIDDQILTGPPARCRVALIWFYEGLWCKVLPGRADQRAIVAGLPLLPAGAITPLLLFGRMYEDVGIELAAFPPPGARGHRWSAGAAAAGRCGRTTGGLPAGAYDAVTLSNVLDGPGPEFARRLRAAVRHAVRPGGVVVLRSIREPGPAGPGLAAEDRSMLWGVVRVTRVADRGRDGVRDRDRDRPPRAGESASEGIGS
ncbi:hypothetical protein ABH930_005131 [Kitasatospora sp. GAS204A]|uniref:hypothetical protein n=1 Tax=unclassified Kitasatospora TaxID=2633591 RepID=UPI002475D940|nr:hypothetical protein [Kitasatospora sp. GAS204B]MDH6121005.1 hypothetical protein [Kitasatospora sp. GAS204B]